MSEAEWRLEFDALTSFHDIDVHVTYAADDGRHLNIPVDEALRSVGDDCVGTVAACLTFAQNSVGREVTDGYSSAIEVSLMDCGLLEEDSGSFERIEPVVLLDSLDCDRVSSRV